MTRPYGFSMGRSLLPRSVRDRPRVALRRVVVFVALLVVAGGIGVLIADDDRSAVRTVPDPRVQATARELRSDLSDTEAREAAATRRAALARKRVQAARRTNASLRRRLAQQSRQLQRARQAEAPPG